MTAHCEFCGTEPTAPGEHRCEHGEMCFLSVWGHVPAPAINPGTYGACWSCTMAWRARAGWPQYYLTPRKRKGKTADDKLHKKLTAQLDLLGPVRAKAD